MRNEKLGDKMPVNHNVKWGDMKAGESHLSDEWHSMEACEPKFSEKWDEQHPSTVHTSEKFVEMNAGSTEFSDKWHAMEQGGRKDPYSMFPSEGDRTVGMKSTSKSPVESHVRRSNQTTGENGTYREI